MSLLSSLLLELRAAYPLKTDYLAFMGRYSSLVGAAAFLMMFVGAQVNQLLGWRSAAMTTPGTFCYYLIVI